MDARRGRHADDLAAACGAHLVRPLPTALVMRFGGEEFKLQREAFLTAAHSFAVAIEAFDGDPAGAAAVATSADVYMRAYLVAISAIADMATRSRSTS